MGLLDGRYRQRYGLSVGQHVPSDVHHLYERAFEYRVRNGWRHYGYLPYFRRLQRPVHGQPYRNHKDENRQVQAVDSCGRIYERCGYHRAVLRAASRDELSHFLCVRIPSVGYDLYDERYFVLGYDAFADLESRRPQQPYDACKHRRGRRRGAFCPCNPVAYAGQPGNRVQRKQILRNRVDYRLHSFLCMPDYDGFCRKRKTFAQSPRGRRRKTFLKGNVQGYLQKRPVKTRYGGDAPLQYRQRYHDGSCELLDLLPLCVSGTSRYAVHGYFGYFDGCHRILPDSVQKTFKALDFETFDDYDYSRISSDVHNKPCDGRRSKSGQSRF